MHGAWGLIVESLGLSQAEIRLGASSFLSEIMLQFHKIFLSISQIWSPGWLQDVFGSTDVALMRKISDFSTLELIQMVVKQFCK